MFAVFALLHGVKLFNSILTTLKHLLFSEYLWSFCYWFHGQASQYQDTKNTIKTFEIYK